MAEPLTLDGFLDAFSYFEGTSFELVEAKLAMAHDAYSGCVDYPQYYGIVGNHAAHLLCIDPGGHTMKVDLEGHTVYSRARDTLLAQVPRSGVVVV